MTMPLLFYRTLGETIRSCKTYGIVLLFLSSLAVAKSKTKLKREEFSVGPSESDNAVDDAPLLDRRRGVCLEIYQ